MKYKHELPAPGEVKVPEISERYIDFIIEKQLKDRDSWKLFVRAFTDNADTENLGWRGEYWGKMMRGACLVYRCRPDRELYDILKEAIENLLDAAEADGRISSYSREKEFNGWDMWSRKYVLTGMIHFHDICDDELLKARIIEAMKLHLDCIINNVGLEEGKRNICETSNFWLGVNSCSILEPVLNLYKITGAKRYLDFAEYIIGTGGIIGGNLIELAVENKLKPYEYPETKAYETMSFFEGLLAYYEITDNKRYLDAVINFAEAVNETDITIIGCAGCTHELFDNSAAKQTEYSDVIMQETCVTVTWMRLMLRLLMVTGDDKYAARIKNSALNALHGSVNFNGLPVQVKNRGLMKGLPFDSYSPLYMNTRGREIGGLQIYEDGRYYGCCACIAAAGIAVYPISETMRGEYRENEYRLEMHLLNNRKAFTYGPFVLARDQAKEDCDITIPFETDVSEYELLSPESGENVRIRLKTNKGYVLLTDYASCGMHAETGYSLMSVWLD